MKIAVHHTFTTTPGVENGQIIKTFEYQYPENFQGIKSKRELYHKIIWKNGKAISPYQKLHKFIEELENHIISKYGYIVDPIKYLAYLYYHDSWDGSLSSIEIYHRIGKLWWYKRDNVFTKMFKNTFWWEMKDGSIFSKRTKKRLAEKSSWQRVGWTAYDRKKQHLNEAKEYIENQKASEENKLDITIYSQLQNQRQRAYYILTQRGYITNEHDFEQKIIELQNKYGCSVTANIVEQIVHCACEEMWVSKTNFEKNRVMEIIKAAQ